MFPVNIWTHSASLKFNIEKLRLWDPAPSFMANRRKNVEAMTDFFILASKTTVNGAHGQEMRRL